MLKLKFITVLTAVLLLGGCCGLVALTPEGCPVEDEAYEERREAKENGCESGYYPDEDDYICEQWEGEGDK